MTESGVQDRHSRASGANEKPAPMQKQAVQTSTHNQYACKQGVLPAACTKHAPAVCLHRGGYICLLTLLQAH
jgi:hypothetical protein